MLSLRGPAGPRREVEDTFNDILLRTRDKSIDTYVK